VSIGGICISGVELLGFFYLDTGQIFKQNTSDIKPRSLVFGLVEAVYFIQVIEASEVRVA
jgi:hypothetical protein